MSFGEQLDSILKMKSLHPADLAFLCDIRESTVYRWLKNKTTPNMVQLVNICRALGCSADYLLEIEPITKQIVEIPNREKRGLIISDAIKNGIQGTKVVNEEPSEEYKKLQEEANERIKESRRQEAKAYIRAQNYVSD